MLCNKHLQGPYSYLRPQILKLP